MNLAERKQTKKLKPRIGERDLNAKSCEVLVTFLRFGSAKDASAKDCLESSCPMNMCPWSHTIAIWKSCFPAIHRLKITSYCLILIFFVVLLNINWTDHWKLLVFCILKTPHLLFSRHFCKFDQWVFSDNIYWSFLL